MPLKLGHRQGEDDWVALARLAGSLAREHDVPVTVVVDARGRAGLLVGLVGVSGCRDVLTVPGWPRQARTEASWLARVQGWAAYRAIVPAVVGRPKLLPDTPIPATVGPGSESGQKAIDTTENPINYKPLALDP